MITKRKIKSGIITILIIFILTLIIFIWYGELGINKEVPKRARYVDNINMR
ncbi:MAG: hypothetical protein GX981_10370 [Tissierellia bacterium]|nr:hypothetical protein [Tissierellia bacterium]